MTPSVRSFDSADRPGRTPTDSVRGKPAELVPPDLPLTAGVRAPHPRRTVGAARRPAWWLEIALIAACYAIYSMIRNHVGNVRVAAYANADTIGHIENTLALDVERFLNDWLHGNPVFAVPACFYYASLHFVVTPALLIWLYVRRPQVYPRARTVLMLATGAALIGFYLTPTAPPRLIGGAFGLHDIMAEFADWGWWPPSGAPASDAISNPYAAMPSVHCMWAIWVGLVIFACAQPIWVRVLGLAHPIITIVVVMATGNHFLLDAVAGAALLAIALSVVVLFGKRSRARQPTEADETEDREFAR
ncbi:phosphatase PAP2 family protein [Aldersonia sp. NBC_00410]|uniref:phosphatase PAP2 family protein n=1 Tax=Aldersonia sp. NBC_00410 TaxID=2975954 RepID=UPI002256868D|nr:phosphatase PAP2 family protein [Aldersonia sp. NBC_00410]MCX5041756.1 phosphatase PAP2 family protein [Aldersonia sp. NBC_00410]